MQNNGNKLRAFIITFIIMGLLIAAGYFIFKNMKNDNSTKGDSIVKKFTSLFGSSKQTPIDKVTDTNLPDISSPSSTNQSQTNGGSTGTSELPGGSNNSPSDSNPGGAGTTPGSNTVGTAPKLNPFPSYSGIGTYIGSGFTSGGFTGGGFTGGGSGFFGGGTGGGVGYGLGDITPTKTECSDGIDNDKDGKKDAADAGCHTDSKASNAASYFAGWDDEQSENDPVVASEKNICEVNIVFNEEDKKRMDELLRIFYRLAPNLATAEDIKLEVANQKTYENVISKSKEYTAQCYKERTNLGPSRALVNGGEYMLESRKTAYANTTKITPSDTFLPGDKGVSFKTPYMTVSPSYRNKYFTEHGSGKDVDLVINKAVVKPKDRGQAAGSLAAHILQNMHDYGIIKRYIPGKIEIPEEAARVPDKIQAFKGDENYEKVLKILLRETGQYLETLAPGRQEWSDRQGGDNKLESFVGFVNETNADYWGYVYTKEALNLYLRSSDNDDTRKVDFGKITWFSGASEFINEPQNEYKNFEDAFNVW